MRQTVNQIQADTAKTLAAGGFQYAKSLGLTLNPVNRFLHLGIKVLQSQAEPVKANPTQQGNGVGIRLPRVDFNGELTAVVISQFE